jgi:hypothetical protein
VSPPPVVALCRNKTEIRKNLRCVAMVS